MAKGERTSTTVHLRAAFAKLIESDDTIVGASLRGEKAILAPIIQLVQGHDELVRSKDGQIEALRSDVERLIVLTEDLKEQLKLLIRPGEDILSMENDANVLEWAGRLENEISDKTEKRNDDFPLRSLWLSLRVEVHDLLCTNSAKYRNERALFQGTATPAITALSAILTTCLLYTSPSPRD